MHDSIVIYHRKRPTKDTRILTLGQSPWLNMGTCLRQVFIGQSQWPSEAFTDDFERYEGEGAYRFLLEIICGLHSPILGENEVFGQFKAFYKENQEEVLGTDLGAFFQDVFRDAKQIKALYFRGKPAQSYGGLIKRMLNSGEELHLVGAGQLASEIINTLKGRNRIHLYCRSPQKADQFGEKIHSVSKISHLQGPTGLLVIAAPIKASDLHNIGPQTRIIDLRAEGGQDPIHHSQVMSLKTFFAEYQKHQEQIRQIQDTVFRAVREQADRACAQKQHRPFGWEEICA